METKVKGEVDFWKKELGRYVNWYNCKVRELWGIPCPEDGKKVTEYNEVENAVRTWQLADISKYQRRLGLPKNFFAGKKVLDIGCGPIPYSLYFTDCEIFGLDQLIDVYIDLGFPEKWEERHAQVCGVVEKIPFEDNFFDIVISVNSIDHVDDFESAISEIERVLDCDSGLMFIETHYHKATVTEPCVLNESRVTESFKSFDVFKKSEQSVSHFYSKPTHGKNEELVVWSNCGELITLLVACFNKAEYIEECINSILNQDSVRWRCVIIDDASTDSSFETVKELIKFDSRFTLIKNEENLGYTGTLKKLIEIAETDIVGIVDPDDIIHENCVSKVLKQYDSGYKGFVYTDFFDCDIELNFKARGFTRKLEYGQTVLNGHDVVQSLKTFRRSVYFNTPGYVAEEGLYCEDKDIIIKMEELCSLHHIPEMLYYYRRGTPGAQNFGPKRKIGQQNLAAVKEKAFDRRKNTDWSLSKRRCFENLLKEDFYLNFACHPDDLDEQEELFLSIRNQTFPFWRCYVYSKDELVISALKDDQRFILNATSNPGNAISVISSLNVDYVEENSKIIVQGLWLGGKLTSMERMSIASFISNGHEYHLYVYDDVGDVPDGTILKDAEEILPKDSVFQHISKDAKGSYSTFSNVFRYKLLLEKGGWWADTDFVCIGSLSRFRDREYVFATERSRKTRESSVTSGIMKLPVNSLFAENCLDFALKKIEGGIENIGWGEIGVGLVKNKVHEMGLLEHSVNPEIFCPVNWDEVKMLLESGHSLEFNDNDTVTVHLWNEIWRQHNFEKDNAYPDDSFYESKRRFFLKNQSKCDILFIHEDRRYPDLWHLRYQENAEKFNIPFRKICVFADGINFLDSVTENSYLVGRYGHAGFDLTKIKPVFHTICRKFKNRTNVNAGMYYHYDEKHKQIDFFKKHNFLIPKSELCLDLMSAQQFVDKYELDFPIVVKSIHGSASRGVYKVDGFDEIKKFPCLLQEFVPADGTIRITTIGNRVMGYFRPNAKNDFRSASANVISPVYWSEFDFECLKIANDVSKVGLYNTMAYDFLEYDGRYYLLEMSCSYPYEYIRDCNFYYDFSDFGNISKVDKTGIYPQDFIMEDMELIKL